MSEPINFLVIDLSHYDPANDYAKVKAAGIVGVIYKATQGTGYSDPTYTEQRTAALKAGLKWGAYHFGDAHNVDDQVANFLSFAQIDSDSLFCLDYEPNGSNTMSLSQAKDFITKAEQGLGRPGECVLYSGSQIKEQLGNKLDDFWSSHRLWLAQYGPTPSWPPAWETFWLWQYTDGTSGPSPHTVAGCDSGGVDCNSYAGTPDQLAAEWASGTVVPPPPPPPPPSDLVVTITIAAPAGVTVNVVQNAIEAQYNHDLNVS
jgi:GH25 family lysozyme M1 (1,4-beta-N-acetylmuramidase)